MQVHGKTGYLGEFELSGSLSEQTANGRKEYSGPLVGTLAVIRGNRSSKESKEQLLRQWRVELFALTDALGQIDGCIPRARADCRVRSP